MKNVAALLALGIFSLSAASMRADSLSVLAADNFAVLGASAVTNTGPTVLNGNLGVYPGTSISGFPPGIVNGTTYDGNAGAQSAQTDALAAYNQLAGLSVTQTLTGVDLGGLTLTPGVYFYSSSAQLTGMLTLDFQNLTNANIVFQIGSTLTTASASSVDIINLGTNDNIYWQVGTSATLGTTTAFQGTIIADQSVTLTTGANINCGSAIALNAAVTLDTNNINACGTGGAIPTPVPEPGTLALLSTGTLAAGAMSSDLSLLGLCGVIAGFCRKLKL
jgi:hypothetical protein